MSFIQELKRRNVFRVGIAYAVASWLLLQLTEILSTLLELQTDIGKIVIILLLVGFPVALFFAWAFEMTPEGLKKEKDVDRSESIAPQTGKKLNNTILILMAMAIAYLMFDKFSTSAQPGSDPFSQQTAGEIKNKNSRTVKKKPAGSHGDSGPGPGLRLGGVRMKCQC